MAGAGTPRPRTPMLHVENRRRWLLFAKGGERKRRGGDGRGDGEACILIQLFFFSTNWIGRVGWTKKRARRGHDKSGQWLKSRETRKTTSHNLLLPSSAPPFSCCPFPHVTNLVSHAICYASREKCGQDHSQDAMAVCGSWTELCCSWTLSSFRLLQCDSTISHTVSIICLDQNCLFY